MLCPFDATTLQVLNRSGVEIEWCPSCKGVWLERGELDKLIDQAGAMLAPSPAAATSHDRRPDARYEDRRDWDDDDDDDWDDRRRSEGSRFRGTKRKNLLSEIFDF